MNNIQMVKTSEDNYLFIIGFNNETGELTFRTSRQPNHLQTEKVFIEGDVVHTNLYFFNISYLKKFLSEAERN